MQLLRRQSVAWDAKMSNINRQTIRIFRRPFIILALTALLTPLFVLEIYAAVAPLGLAEFDFLYDRFERGDALEPDVTNYQLGPYAIENVQGSFGPLGFLLNNEQEKLSLFGIAGEKFTSARQSQSTSFESFRGGLVARPSKKLFVYGSFDLDEQKAGNPNYSGKQWRGLAGGVRQAFAQYQSGDFNLLFGRFASFWGPRNSLVLASNVSMDGFGYSYKWGRLTLSYRLARLDGLDPDIL
jgi:hypothetical protein